MEKSGYVVYPYGYESTFSDIRKKLSEKGAKNSPTARRMRSSPDLLVYDDQRKDVMLVEIKMRAHTSPWLESQKIDTYKEFWCDSILVIAVPVDNVFYAQRINALKTKEKYDPIADFEKIQEIFTRVKTEDVSHFGAEALKIIGKNKQKTDDM